MYNSLYTRMIQSQAPVSAHHEQSNASLSTGESERSEMSAKRLSADGVGVGPETLCAFRRCSIPKAARQRAACEEATTSAETRKPNTSALGGRCAAIWRRLSPFLARRVPLPIAGCISMTPQRSLE